MIIKGGIVFQEDKTFRRKEIQVENGRIVAVSEPDGNRSDMVEYACHSNDEKVNRDDAGMEQVIDATGLYVLPGLIDVHSHGAVGCDFSDGDLEGLREILAYQCAHGVTSYCPTSMTMSKDKLLKIYKRVKGFNVFEEGVGRNGRHTSLASVPGFNMEGPFLDSVKKGAHGKEDIIAPDVDFFLKCDEACGNRIRLVTVAPNADGALEFIREIVRVNENVALDNGRAAGRITISLGHTSADYDTSKAALSAGATHITHLFNAMSPMNHRSPGLVGAAAEVENCFAELICDGIHVHESMIRTAFKLFSQRIVLVSDSMRATGLVDGYYDLGGQQVQVVGNLAKLSDGTIAGSVTNLFDCMRKAISFGIVPEEAIAAATINPAKSIGIYDEVGSLTVGKCADIILVDKDFNLVTVLKA